MSKSSVSEILLCSDTLGIDLGTEVEEEEEEDKVGVAWVWRIEVGVLREGVVVVVVVDNLVWILDRLGEGLL